MSECPISSFATLSGTPARCRSVQKVCLRQYGVKSFDTGPSVPSSLRKLFHALRMALSVWITPFWFGKTRANGSPFASLSRQPRSLWMGMSRIPELVFGPFTSLEPLSFAVWTCISLCSKSTSDQVRAAVSPGLIPVYSNVSTHNPARWCSAPRLICVI